MLGNEAIARGAWEAGVKVSSAYPGTPSTEVSENLVKYDGVCSEWAPNEKVATEVALGASMAGVRSMTMMKMVGLNVASDPLFAAGYTGVGGGMVLVVADDPGIYSSQNEQDTRMVARAAMIPVVEPSDSEEARVFTKRAYELSEEFDTPVILRTTTRLAHSQGIVNLEERIEPADRAYERDVQKNVMMPGMAIKRHVFVEERMKRMSCEASSLDINTTEYNSKKLGVITSGIPYQYVKEALPEASVLKLGLVHPLPKKLIREFAGKVDRLVVVEELEPVIEEQVKAMGIACEGKNLFTIQGEYSAAMLAGALGDVFGSTDAEAGAAGTGTTDAGAGAPAESSGPGAENSAAGGTLKPADEVPARPPILCPGCPHRATYSVLKKLKIHAAGDIGCYTLGAVSPLSVVDTTVCMGSGISTLHGMEKAKGKDFIKNWVAVIGDSTFLHTGVNALMNMVYNKATGTVIILDNSTTGMTGHQDHPATGKTLAGEETNAVILDELCRAVGVRHVCVVDAFDVERLEAVIREEVARDDVSVIISQSPCALLKSYVPKGKCVVSADKCRKCGMCLSSGCPAITRNDDRTVSINASLCNGCGLCMSSCRFGAIKLNERGTV